MGEARNMFVRLLRRLAIGRGAPEVDPDGFAAELVRLLRPCAHDRLRGLRDCPWCDSYEQMRRSHGWDRDEPDDDDEGPGRGYRWTVPARLAASENS